MFYFYSRFSALASAASPRDGVAASMTMMVCLGFGLTIPAIGLMTRLEATHGPWVGWALAAGPLAGLALMRTGGAGIKIVLEDRHQRN